MEQGGARSRPPAFDRGRGTHPRPRGAPLGCSAGYEDSVSRKGCVPRPSGLRGLRVPGGKGDTRVSHAACLIPSLSGAKSMHGTLKFTEPSNFRRRRGYLKEVRDRVPVRRAVAGENARFAHARCGRKHLRGMAEAGFQAAAAAQ